MLSISWLATSSKTKFGFLSFQGSRLGCDGALWDNSSKCGEGKGDKLRTKFWVSGPKMIDQADILGLSGLITPSLDEMIHVAREMERQVLASWRPIWQSMPYRDIFDRAWIYLYLSVGRQPQNNTLPSRLHRDIINLLYMCWMRPGSVKHFAVAKILPF